MGAVAVPFNPQQALAILNQYASVLSETALESARKNFSDQLAKIAPNATGINELSGPQFQALSSLSNALPGVTAGALLAVDGFEDGDALAGVQGIMDACASLAPATGAIVGFAAGPEGALPGYFVGSVIGAIFSMISEIFGFLAPKAESLAKTISRLLDDQKAEEAQSNIRTVHNRLWEYATSLDNECKTISSNRNFSPGVTTSVIDKMNFIDGNTVDDYLSVINWLADPNNVNHRLWPLILNGACDAYTLVLAALVRIHSVANTTAVFERYKEADERKDETSKKELRDLWNSAIAQLRVLSVSNKLIFEQLTNITPLAQNRGTLWRLVANLECGVVDPNVTVSHFGGDDKRLSVTVCSKDQTRPDPAYYEYAVAWPGVLYYRRVTSSAKKVADTEAVGATTLDNQPHIDVFATPGTDLTKPNHACVYQLLDGGRRIQGKYRDENGSEIGDICNFVLPTNDSTNLISVRAVHDPYGFEDDPERGSLKGTKSIVYAACQGSDKILFLWNGRGWGEDGKMPHYFRIPFEAKGIAVDQDYLWVFSETQVGCITHARAILLGGDGSPKPLISFPSNGIDSVYPCDDGTLVVSFKGAGVSSVAYRVHLRDTTIPGSDGKPVHVKRNTITGRYTYVMEWKKIRDSETRGGLEKLPVFCWPQFESLTETLEKFQKAFSAQGAHA
jgi:hypothetical protein